MARPIEYNEKLHPKLAEKCYADGMTNDEAAEYMEIARSTLHEWRKKYKAFSDAIDRGKNAVDDKVESKLLQKAMGYEEDAVKIFQHLGEPVIVDYIKKYQPDLGAIKMWLNNRRPDKWSEKYEHTHKGNITLNFDERFKDV
jgi:hypothetical protein